MTDLRARVVEEALQRLFPVMQPRESTVAAIEAAIIEATGNGEFAAYTARYLLDAEKRNKEGRDVFQRLHRENEELRAEIGWLEIERPTEE